MISVIVPVYKVERYLHRCVDSILSQSYADFELLLVDDGSPDCSGAICDEYAKKDNRVKVIHKENEGVIAARADGVKSSSGEWVTFVDSDDSLPDGALGILNSYIDKDFDIIRGNYNVIEYKNKQAYFKKAEFIHEKEILGAIEYRRETICNKKLVSGPWASLIRKSLFNYETFNVPRLISFGEDQIMNIRLAFANNKKVKIISEPVYNYIQNEGSCVHTFKLNLNYIKEWYRYILESIPTEEIEKYVYELVELRLKYTIYLRKYYIDNRVWKKDSYHKELLSDIRKSKYKLLPIDKITLSFSNPITNTMCLILSKMIKEYDKIKCRIKR